MMSAFLGLILVVAGVLGLLKWYPDVLAVARGLGVVSLIFGGLVAFVMGLSTLGSKSSNGETKP